MTIQVLRLKDGYDIIGDVEENSFYYTISFPMLFELNSGRLIMQQWLPMTLVKDDFVKLKQDDVLCVMSPNDELSNYYGIMVNKVMDVLYGTNNNQEPGDQELITSAMEELESSKGTLIH